MNKVHKMGAGYIDIPVVDGYEPENARWDAVPATGLAAYCQRRPGDFPAVEDARAALVVGIAAFVWEN